MAARQNPAPEGLNTLAPTQVLIVDDHPGYRQAFRRNLALRGYDVQEAEDGEAALARLHEAEPDVVVTDLAMRHPKEGLDLIRQVRSLRPHLPVIMISAVGTFDEGAEATRLGAWGVISKSRIDEEIERLYEAIDAASRQHARARSLSHEIQAEIRRAGADRRAGLATLQGLLRREDIPAGLKGEIFDHLLTLTEEQAQSPPARPGRRRLDGEADADRLGQAEESLAEAVSALAELATDSRQSLTTAEYLFLQSRTSPPGVDFSRSMGFAYCFAVENEAKARLRKRIQRFLNEPGTPALIEALLEPKRNAISIFYQQYLLRAQKSAPHEATIDNYYYTFARILEHGGKYRPDGLKALGIMLICFGRTYRFRKFQEEIQVENPLGLTGLADAEVYRLGSLLINLQHYRNPYIHPEISEMTKVSQIRETALDCLNLIARLS